MSILTLSLIISLASLGVRAITDKGMIFYFLRKPFDKLQERKKRLNREGDEILSKIEDIENELRETPKGVYAKNRTLEMENLYDEHHKIVDKDPYKYNWLLHIMKPFLLCSTCMASVHTLIWYPILTGEFTYKLILVMLIVAILNTVGWLLVEVMRSCIKREQLLKDDIDNNSKRLEGWYKTIEKSTGDLEGIT